MAVNNTEVLHVGLEFRFEGTLSRNQGEWQRICSYYTTNISPPPPLRKCARIRSIGKDKKKCRER